jgi:hypothetical protein
VTLAGQRLRQELLTDWPKSQGDARRVDMASRGTDRRAKESPDAGDARRAADVAAHTSSIANESREDGEARRTAHIHVQEVARVVLYDVRARETHVQGDACSATGCPSTSYS